MEDKLIDEEQILSNIILVSDYQDYFEELEDKYFKDILLKRLFNNSKKLYYKKQLNLDNILILYKNNDDYKSVYTILTSFIPINEKTKEFYIYKLKDKKDALTKLEGYGEKSVTNLLNAIEDSKSNSLERLLSALGIKNVGKEKAKILAKTYKNMDNLSKANYDELVEIPDIGPIISKNIVDYFNNIDNLKMIEELKELGLKMDYIGDELNVKEDFQDKSFVLTGTLTKLTRDEAKALIENAGGKTVGSVSKKTYAVIVGASPGSKYKKAKELNIPIWTEEEFLEKINS